MDAQNVAPISLAITRASEVANVRREERREVIGVLRDVKDSIPAARGRDDAIGRAFSAAATMSQGTSPTLLTRPVTTSVTTGFMSSMGWSS